MSREGEGEALPCLISVDQFVSTRAESLRDTLSRELSSSDRELLHWPDFTQDQNARVDVWPARCCFWQLRDDCGESANIDGFRQFRALWRLCLLVDRAGQGFRVKIDFTEMCRLTNRKDEVSGADTASAVEWFGERDRTEKPGKACPDAVPQ
ncbi:hypothetical protein Q9233_000031 [Columba guinea]|nr:hypothetical protein Q9233_000031 [Columba guinea]